MIGCDGNFQHLVWGSTDTTERGQELATIHLNIHDTGKTPQFRNAIREKVLDLTLCSVSLVERIPNGCVCDELALSDHMEIEFELAESITLFINRIRTPRHTNWERFRLHVQDALGEPEGPQQ